MAGKNVHTLGDYEDSPNREPLPNVWQQSQEQTRPAAGPNVQQGAGVAMVDYGGEMVPADSLGPFQYFMLSCCPCLIGDPCSPEKKAAYIAGLKTFVAIACILEVLVFFVELAVGGVAPLSENPHIGPSTKTFIDMGGKFTPLIVHKFEIYRLVVPIFLHAGFLHIFMNLYAQIRMCIQLEQEWGTLVAAPIFMISGIGGCLLSAVLNAETVGVGASGAIVGMLGAHASKVVVRWKQMHPLERRVVGGQLALTTLLMFMIGFSPYIDGTAHAGGFFCGGLMGFVVFLPLARENPDAMDDGKIRLLRYCAVGVLIFYALLMTLLLFTAVNVPHYDG